MIYSPYRLQIETTSYCNLNCKGCLRETDTDLGQLGPGFGAMESDLFYHILDMIDTNLPLFPWINGEPLLHPKFHEFALEMNKRNQRYCLSTNGQLWKEDSFQAITDDDSSCYYLIFSIDGLYNKTNDTLRRGADLNKTIENLNRFIELKKTKNSKIDIGVKAVDNGQDYEELEDLIFHWLCNTDIDFVSVTSLMFPDGSDKLRHYPCKAFYNDGVLVVRHGGDIIRCGYNEHSTNDPNTFLGNIREYRTITEAFNSDKHNELRRQDTTREFTYPCDKCSIAYCGEGFHGMIAFRNEEKRKKIPFMYWHNDSFQSFYSLEDTRGTNNLFDYVGN